MTIGNLSAPADGDRQMLVLLKLSYEDLQRRLEVLRDSLKLAHEVFNSSISGLLWETGVLPKQRSTAHQALPGCAQQGDTADRPASDTGSCCSC